MSAHAKRWMFLIHRWLGIAVCLFFAMWFVSGIVMVYVGYPKLTHAERLAHLPALDTASGLLGPAQALQAGDVHGPLTDLRLAVASGGRVVYLAVPQTAHRAERHGAAKTVVVDARTGERLQSFGAAWAKASAAAFAGPGVAVQHLDTIDEDAFTHTRSLDPHRPLHRLQLDDAAGTLLYVSSSTGEVVRDAPRVERAWNYVGSWIHWLYMFRGGTLDAHWADIVNWLSIVCTAVAITGTVVGVWRWRFTRPYRSGARTPYPSRMMRWHHVTGLLFAAITLTWIFSGLMSMNPWKVFDSGAEPLRVEAMQGGALTVAAQEALPQRLLQAAGKDIRELRWTRVLGQVTVLAQGMTGKPRLLDAQTAQPRAVDESALRSAAASLLPASVQRIERLDHYDLHYYARADHTMTGGADKPLPILRVVFDDPHASWVHLDAQTGAVLGRTDKGRRASRWLFAMLHSWDWLPLLDRRPLWDVLLVALSVGGAFLSITGVVIAWRRLDLKLRSSRASSRRVRAA